MEHNAYSVGWICALPDTELPVAEAMLDEEHPPPDKDPADSNMYACGRIGPHKVVIACLPAGHCGTVSASEVAQNMLRSFPTIKIGLMVGIGGGVPSLDDDIRLGDVVVSQPTKGHGGVVQYDMGKAMDECKFEMRGHLDAPPPALLNAISKLRGRHVRKEPEYLNHLSEMLKENPRMAKTFARPGPKYDNLSAGVAQRITPKTQDEHGDQNRFQRSPRAESIPHYGLIASGNKVVASVDEGSRIEGLMGRGDRILCFEMEAAGLMNDFRCVVIRGISDYADSLKTDKWQPFAAAAAAAYAKELLTIIPAESVANRQETKGGSPRSEGKAVSQGSNTFENTSASNSRMLQGNFSGVNVS